MTDWGRDHYLEKHTAQYTVLQMTGISRTIDSFLIKIVYTQLMSNPPYEGGLHEKKSQIQKEF